MGKESEKEGIYLWIPESSCCTPKIKHNIVKSPILQYKNKKPSYFRINGKSLEKKSRLFSWNEYRKKVTKKKKNSISFFLNKGEFPWKNSLTASHVCLLGNTESRRCHPRRSKGLGPGSSLRKHFHTCRTGGIGLGPQQKQTQHRAVAVDIKEERGH